MKIEADACSASPIDDFRADFVTSHSVPGNIDVLAQSAIRNANEACGHEVSYSGTTEFYGGKKLSVSVVNSVSLNTVSYNQSTWSL